jgi:uncharacterized membrane protein YphA (DoxX/SURF4 family)
VTDGLHLDPALLGVLRFFLALVLLHAAQHKLRDPASFAGSIADYRILPASLASAAGALLSALELSIGIAILVPATAPQAAAAAALLLLVYSGAILVNLLRGRRDLDCGCSGPARRRPIGEELLFRNALLVLASVTCAGFASTRPLVALDVVTIAGGAGTLALLYAAADGAIAHAPGLAALRRDR